MPFRKRCRVSTRMPAEWSFWEGGRASWLALPDRWATMAPRWTVISPVEGPRGSDTTPEG